MDKDGQQLAAAISTLRDRLPPARSDTIHDSNYQYIAPVIRISNTQFFSGKCCVEAAVLAESEPERRRKGELVDASPVAQNVDPVPVTPHELSVNWMTACTLDTPSKHSRLCAGGTVELTLARTGIPQGASIKAKPKAAAVAAAPTEEDSSTSCSAHIAPNMSQRSGECSHPVSRLCQR